jgi:1-acyl-sn-glycerol-3-phosphate acyltransferase
MGKQERMIARVWRALRTGIAFATFGIYSLGIFATAVPWVRLVCRDPVERQLRVQATVNRAFRHFLALLRGLGLTRLRVDGLEKLREPGILVMANHPTLIDAVAILAQMPQAVVVTKHANQTNPFMGGTVRGAGYISNLDGRTMVADCAERLRMGHSVVLFPEGTRSPKGGLGEFHRGAARIALASGCDILPVIATCDPPTLMRDQPWWDVPDRPFEYALRVGTEVRVGPYCDSIAAGESRARVARRLTAELREGFGKALGLDA